MTYRKISKLNYSAGSILGLSYSKDSARYEVSVACGNGQLVIHELEVEGDGILKGETVVAFLKNVDEFDKDGSSS